MGSRPRSERMSLVLVVGIAILGNMGTKILSRSRAKFLMSDSKDARLNVKVRVSTMLYYFILKKHVNCTWVVTILFTN